MLSLRGSKGMTPPPAAPQRRRWRPGSTSNGPRGSAPRRPGEIVRSSRGGGGTGMVTGMGAVGPGSYTERTKKILSVPVSRILICFYQTKKTKRRKKRIHVPILLCSILKMLFFRTLMGSNDNIVKYFLMNNNKCISEI